MDKFTLPELLAPAGNMERLVAAFRYGADACYVGATTMSLRNFADNFTFPQLQEACDYAHLLNKKVYLACNSFASDEDIDTLPDFFTNAASSGIDALIVNDPGVIRIAKNTIGNSVELHLSTQANTQNSSAATFWYEQGIKRVILARELSLESIRRMRERIPKDLEIEMFVHGAMCVSYSGRCLLSSYLTGRDSNKGECAQPCRWSYEIREMNKDGEYFPIEQDGLGTHILNSRDMNLIEHIPELIQSGVCSLKIEGRMKSVLYVATVVNAYRTALDLYAESVNSGKEYVLPDYIKEELCRASHRPFTTGFAFGNPKENGQMPFTSKYVTDYDIVAVVLSYNKETKTAYVRQRNRFFVGDELSILAPKDTLRTLTVASLMTDENEYVDSAPHPNQHLYLPSDEELMPGDILRKKVNNED